MDEQVRYETAGIYICGCRFRVPGAPPFDCPLHPGASIAHSISGMTSPVGAGAAAHAGFVVDAARPS